MTATSDTGGFRFIGERDRLSGGFLRLTTATFIDPDGFTFEREIVRHPGAVCIAALEDDAATVWMVRQYRAALDRYVLELPAGKLDRPGEEPEACAARELAEEVGRAARRWSELGSFYNSPGYTDELTYAFLAEDLVSVDMDRQGVEEQHLLIEPFALDEVFARYRKGELVDAKSLVVMSLASAELERRSG